MPDDNRPLVSVVTVNHDGAELTAALLESLRRQTYDRHEVVVVDNASSDDSVAVLGRRFPEARILELDTNRGFVGGNNAGIRAARGCLVALANNDTVADPRWLEELVAAAEADPGVAAVASKILFLKPFLELRFEVLGQGGPVFVGEASRFAGCDYHKPVFRQGFAGGELVHDTPARQLTGTGTLFLPLGDAGGVATLELWTSAAEPAWLGVEVVGEEGEGYDLGTLQVGRQLRVQELEVPAERVAAAAVSLINNVGTRLSPAGEAADRGIYEPDRGGYDQPQDLESVCGAAVLFRRSALDTVGLFDRDFFMYYEDTDLSWRLRQAGYRLRYQPASVIRHVHAASSVEWSPLFVFHTARNRLLMIAKNGSPSAFVRAYLEDWRNMLGFLWRALRGPGAAPRTHYRRQLATRARVHASLIWQLPKAVLKRAGMLAH